MSAYSIHYATAVIAAIHDRMTNFHIQIEELNPEDFEIGIGLPSLPDPEERMSRTADLKYIIDNIIERHDSLKEFEEELEKHKKDITPGQVGEA